MTKKYSNLFQLEINHSFYQDGLSRDFLIKPSPFTQRMMSKLDVRVKPEPSGMKLYWGHQEQNGETKGPLLQMNSPVVLTFLLEAKNPNFLNYTQIDLADQHTPNEKFYYPPASESTAELEGAKTLFLPAQQLVEFTPPEQEDTKLEVSLKDIASNVIFTETLSAEDAQKGTYALTLSSEEDWGQYKLSFTNITTQKTEEKIIHVLPGSLLPTTWAVIQFIVPPKPVPNADGPIYRLAFTSRDTIWRYNIIDQSKGVAYDDIRLLRNETVSEGVTSAQKTLTNGAEATVLTMSTPLPLQERTQEKIEVELLQKQADDTPAKSLLKMQLPTPDTNRIYPERDGDKLLVYSDLYVYL